MTKKKIGIIGCGNMGQAIMSRICSIVKPSQILASDTDARKRRSVRRRFGIVSTDDNILVAESADIILLAIKPQTMDALLREIACVVTKDKIVISIAAGVTTARIEHVLGKGRVPVVRAMPNMPAIVGEAISAVCRGRYATRSHLLSAKKMLSSIGETVEVEERYMDAVTAVSGSGPAYFFYLMESMIESAVSLGLKSKTARRLVVKTALGSARIAAVLGEDAASLRKRVASRGGTTEAALRVFESRYFKKILREAIRKAALRSKQLSS